MSSEQNVLTNLFENGHCEQEIKVFYIRLRSTQCYLEILLSTVHVMFNEFNCNTYVRIFTYYDNFSLYRSPRP